MSGEGGLVEIRINGVRLLARSVLNSLRRFPEEFNYEVQREDPLPELHDYTFIIRVSCFCFAGIFRSLALATHMMGLQPGWTAAPMRHTMTLAKDLLGLEQYCHTQHDNTRGCYCSCLHTAQAVQGECS